ncbi:protein HIGH ARSENIC CONTENT 1, mitochondrial-like isoform X1 [Musa acuminata AAA Group]|uniref:protein HIGH ARSENIC CONTENT 1, mitochondrial-like isoform X1 n=1 Tax=Musa acuminata AAA Group TaxID=214697 RepID=UPI0031E0B21B
MEGQKSAVDIVTVDGHEARGLVASGNRYLDVRLEEDFEKGHAEGALNIPYYSSVTPQEKVKNPRFIEQVSSLFGKDEVFIVGCRSGVRAKRATVDLLDAFHFAGFWKRQVSCRRLPFMAEEHK